VSYCLTGRDVTEEASGDGLDEWRRTAVEREHNWYNVSGLRHGRAYRLRMGATVMIARDRIANTTGTTLADCGTVALTD